MRSLAGFDTCTQWFFVRPCKYAPLNLEHCLVRAIVSDASSRAPNILRVFETVACIPELSFTHAAFASLVRRPLTTLPPQQPQRLVHEFQSTLSRHKVNALLYLPPDLRRLRDDERIVPASELERLPEHIEEVLLVVRIKGAVGFVGVAREVLLPGLLTQVDCDRFLDGLLNPYSLPTTQILDPFLAVGAVDPDLECLQLFLVV